MLNNRDPPFILSLSFSRARAVCIWISFALSLIQRILCVLVSLSLTHSSPRSLTLLQILLLLSLFNCILIHSPIGILIYRWMDSLARTSLVILIDIHLFSYIPWSIVHRPTNGRTIFPRFSSTRVLKKFLYDFFYRIYSKSFLDILDIYTYLFLLNTKYMT